MHPSAPASVSFRPLLVQLSCSQLLSLHSVHSMPSRSMSSQASTAVPASRGLLSAPSIRIINARRNRPPRPVAASHECKWLLIASDCQPCNPRSSVQAATDYNPSRSGQSPQAIGAYRYQPVRGATNYHPFHLVGRRRPWPTAIVDARHTVAANLGRLPVLHH